MEQGFGSFLQGLNGIVQNPMFMAGASIYRGGDPTQAMANAQQVSAQRQRLEQENRMRQQWQQMSQSGQLPKAIAPFAGMIDPRQGASMLFQNALKAPERERQAKMDEARLRLMRAQTEKMGRGPETRYMKSGSQIIALGPDGKPRVLHQAPLTPEQKIYETILNRMNGGGQPPAAVPTPPIQPQLMPQSYGDQPVVSDPRFIEAPTASPPQPGVLDGLTKEQMSTMMLNKLFPGSGNLMFKQQQAAPGVLTAPSKNQVQKDLIGYDDGFARLKGIQQLYKPEYLTMYDRLGLEWESLKTKWWPGYKMSPEVESQVKDYSVFRRQSAENIDLYIKEITGAQMSEAEAQRLTLAQPNAGQGLFDGDDPVRFKAKLDDAVASVALARARKYWLLKNNQIGKDFDFSRGAPITLDQMKQKMQKRRRTLLQDAKLRFRNNPEQQRGYVIQAMQQEFGI